MVPTSTEGREARGRHGARGEVSFTIEPLDPADDAVRLSGELRMRDAAELWKRLRTITDPRKTGQFDIDVSRVTSSDGGAMALLVELRAELAARGVHCDIVGASGNVAPIVALYSCEDGPCPLYLRTSESTLEQIGRATVHVGHEAKEIVSFFGELVHAAARLIRAPRSGHWRDVPPLVEKAGADAVPIVLLINFLVGFVMAFQSARQLKLFGANVYVADLVGIALTRELAPLMTAIIICGRSGAAFAAEIGSMKVSEEVDALRTLGLGPFGWLVVPRVIALVIVAPILTLLADLTGILGGLVVAVTDLDLSPRGYLTETLTAVRTLDVGSGLVKAGAFAIAIALISCQQGFAASGGAEGVGRRTTATVVTSLFALVLIDSVFTVIFRMAGV